MQNAFSILRVRTCLDPVKEDAKWANNRSKHLIWSFSYLKCLVSLECTSRAQEVVHTLVHTHSCCLPHSLFLSQISIPGSCLEPTTALGSWGHVGCAGLHWEAAGCHPNVRCSILGQSWHLSGLCCKCQQLQRCIFQETAVWQVTSLFTAFVK